MPAAWLQQPVPAPDASAIAAAQARQGVLTKPPGALGRLEELAIELAGLQRRERPQLDRVRIVVFAADHGVAEEGVSAFPQAVTVEMIRNFARGGAAISVLARALGATLEVVDVGAAAEVEPLPGVVSRRAGAGSANFCRCPAMSEAQLHQALAAGREAVERAAAAGADLFIGGEMGIANTAGWPAPPCSWIRPWWRGPVPGWMPPASATRRKWCGAPWPCIATSWNSRWTSCAASAASRSPRLPPPISPPPRPGCRCWWTVSSPPLPP
jgi:nicotinate-nucleotide--dimethylbenzimidazole phosphoribosyltransferase